MEKEEYFAYVCYTSSEVPSETKRDEYNTKTTINFLSTSRHTRIETFRYKRIHIDFDPLGHAAGYLVMMYFDRKDPPILFRNLPEPIAVCETEEEANKVKEEIVNKGYIHHLERNETFSKCEVSLVNFRNSKNDNRQERY